MRLETIKLLRKHREKLLGIGLGNGFLDMTAKQKSLSGTASDWKVLHNKRNSQQDETAMCRMEEIIWKPFIL